MFALYPQYGTLGGPVVMIGFGSIGRGTLALLLQHLNVATSQFVVVGPDEDNDALLKEQGVRKITAGITESNYRDILTPLLQSDSG